jgi:hypothetical protein
MKTNMNRSQRRKLPLAVIATSATAAMGTERAADTDELGCDGEEVQDEQVTDRECPPELPEALVDQAGVADAGDRTEANDHLLVDDQHRDEQGQRPQQRQPVVLAGLGVGRDPAGVVVPHHHDESRAEDGEQGEDAGLPRASAPDVVLLDGAKGPLDVAQVGRVQDGARLLLVGGDVGHLSPPLTDLASCGTTRTEPGQEEATVGAPR